MPRRYSPIIFALLAAACFGASTPFAKLLLGDIDPIPLASLLYLGCGFGLALIKGIQRIRRRSEQKEAPVTRRDLPWLLGAIFAGGVAAPIVLMISLQHTPAATATLLLNFEGVATTLIAGLVFREHIGPRVWWAILIITVACSVLSVDPHTAWGISLGAIGVLGACALWGVDNNVVRQIADKDPLTIAILKGFGAGGFSLVLALLLHKPLPTLTSSLWAMLLGGIGYGVSIVFFILALRSLGAARTSGYFASAPFIGMLLSFALLREGITWQFLLAVPLLIFGVVLLAQESHLHDHQHRPDEHEHRHRHDDEHHAHAHDEETEASPEEYHTHSHIHSALQHAHPHLPDMHHRHTH
ncbi:MAG: DMT family transporter [Armatimonadota bacterium]